nr:11833_t:CDS:2 [Entrophospora candida]
MPKPEKKDNQEKPIELEAPKEENIAELKKEIENLKNKNLRLLADIDNQRKLHVREMIEKTKYSNENLLQQLLFFPDNYERSIQVGQGEKDPKIQNFLTGFRMILNEFQNVLKRQGVEEIKVIPLKDVYDSSLHHALEVEENNDYPEGTILKVLQKGYRIHQQVLRPATVKIRIKVILNKERQETTPSTVFFDEKGEKAAVGKSAKGQALIKPDKVVFEAKRLIGRKFNSKEVQEFRKIAPFEIIEAKNETVEDYLGETIKRAVITVPAYFDDGQRQATKDAGAIAGLQVERIINEPTAAALAYGVDKKKELHTIAVFDLGGGTFDISIIEINEGVFEQGIDLGKDKTALQRLKEAAENAKHELSFIETKDSDEATVDINLPFISADASGPKHFSKKLSRRKLEELVAELLEKLVLPCKNCLKDAGITKVDEVILVGGMTLMPSVRKKVEKIFGKEPNKSVDPDKAVAVGAAIQGSILAGDTKDVLLLDVTPLSLGIAVRSAEDAEEEMNVLIPRNTTIPTEVSRVYSTAQDNQPSVHIQVLQGERARAKDNKRLGTFELSGIELAPAGVPKIEVTFKIDANGIVEVLAKDQKTNKKNNITIKGDSGLSKDEIERMIREAEENKAKDEEFVQNAKTIGEAQAFCRTFEKQIEEFKKHKDFQEDEPQFQDELEKKFPKEEEQKDEKEDTLDVHPEPKDKDKNEKKVAGEKFKEIKEAYEVLSDPEKRQKYDLYGSAEDPAQGFNTSGFSGRSGNFFEDIMKTFFGGDDSITLTFKESVFGTKKNISLNLQKVCSDCRQTGAYSPNDIQECSTCQGTGIVNAIQRTVLGTIRTQIPCSRCQGEGKKIKRKCEKCKGIKFIPKQETIPFVIPSGVKSGERLRYKGIGNDGWYGGERGDIYVVIKVKENPYFQRKGNDIHVNLPISFLDAILGNTVKVITLETRVENGVVKDLEEVKIPAVKLPKKVASATEGILRNIQKETTWNPNHDFIEKNKDIIDKVRGELSKLNNIRFSEDEFVLNEEKKNLIKEWGKLETSLLNEMETIRRQIDEKKVASLAPFRQKSLKLGYCYLCNIGIGKNFSYKLKEEEQRILEIEVVKGAEFCSRKCFLEYCKEYKKHEKIRQEEKKKNRKKIEHDQLLISETQEEITSLIERIDKLEKKELALELVSPERVREEKAKVGFFRRLFQKLGLVKKTDSASLLEMVREEKAKLEDKLEASRDKLKSVWISLAADKQAEQEHHENEKKLLQQKEENSIEEEDSE